MKSQSLPAPAGASHSSKNNTRFFLILFAVIVGAILSAYVIVRLIDYTEQRSEERSRVEAEEKEKARIAERDRVFYISSLTKDPSLLPETWQEAEQLMTKLQIDDDKREELTGAWLKERLSDYRNYRQLFAELAATDPMYKEYRIALNETAKNYNEGKETVDVSVLAANYLPSVLTEVIP